MKTKKNPWEKRVTWGEALQIRATNSPGGLKAQVDKIQKVAGKQVGSRNTFRNLFELTEPPSAATDADAALRARLLVSALGLDLEEWGVDTIELPPIYGPPERVLAFVGGPPTPGGEETGSDQGERGSRWIPISAGQVESSGEATGKAA